jgi:hypothetical protein
MNDTIQAVITSGSITRDDARILSTAIVTDETRTATIEVQGPSVEVTIGSEIEVVVSEAATVIESLNWSSLAMKWDTPPALIDTADGFQVFSYTLGGVTRYRKIPDPYDPEGDSFYSDYTQEVLSGFICSRS